jgi:Zn-dependent peptidase ImmA (M78 family)/transcriptional regulator with XRE-family HTH domain
MAKSPPSDAIPLMLKWAREKQGLSIEQVAASDRIPSKKLAAWESGDGSPSFAQLRKLSKRYKRPMHVFYLPEPPVDFNIVKDRRAITPDVTTLELRRALQLAQERQRWASTYLEEIGAPKVELVGSCAASDNPVSVAIALRNSLGVTIQQQTKCSTAHESLSLWREACENVGIYVFQTTRVAVAEMRGCALPDAYAPTAVLNAADSPTARVFTLIHEVAHILANQSAMDGSGDDEFQLSPRAKIEKFCNRVSAETIVPREDFLAMIPQDWRHRDDAIIRFAASRYGVSRAVIGLRLVETGLADQDYLDQKWRYLQAKPGPDREGGPLQHVLAIARTGERFARLALSAFRSGAIHGGELSELIRMKLNYLPQLEAALYPGRAKALA